MDVGHDILNMFQFFSVRGDMKVGSGVFGELPEGSQPTPPPPPQAVHAHFSFAISLSLA